MAPLLTYDDRRRCVVVGPETGDVGGPSNSELATEAVGDDVGQGGGDAQGAAKRPAKRHWSEDMEGPRPTM